MEYKDYYKIMGVARNATQDEIKRANCPTRAQPRRQNANAQATDH